VSRLRVGVLVSGRGSNLQALVEAAKNPLYPARVVVVCANRPCAALEIAKKARISAEVFRIVDFQDRKSRDLAIARRLRLHGVELVVCAGYDAILDRAFCTVHVVTDNVDGGPVLGQRRVEVRADDTTETLRARIQAEEHQLLPAVVKQLAGQPLPLTV